MVFLGLYGEVEVGFAVFLIAILVFTSAWTLFTHYEVLIRHIVNSKTNLRRIQIFMILNILFWNVLIFWIFISYVSLKLFKIYRALYFVVIIIFCERNYLLFLFSKNKWQNLTHTISAAVEVHVYLCFCNGVMRH